MPVSDYMGGSMTQSDGHNHGLDISSSMVGAAGDSLMQPRWTALDRSAAMGGSPSAASRNIYPSSGGAGPPIPSQRTSLMSSSMGACSFPYHHHHDGSVSNVTNLRKGANSLSSVASKTEPVSAMTARSYSPVVGALSNGSLLGGCVAAAGRPHSYIHPLTNDGGDVSHYGSLSRRRGEAVQTPSRLPEVIAAQSVVVARPSSSRQNQAAVTSKSATRLSNVSEPSSDE